jgi:hypothetical protein
MGEYRLLDIDNCISNDGWRIPLIDWSCKDPFHRYHEYHIRAPFDLLGNAGLIHPMVKLVFVTSRPVLYRGHTTEWLARRGISFDHLLMRNNDDHRTSVDVKRWQVQQLVLHYGIPLRNILDAYDDRQEIVDMYRLEFQIDARVAKCHDICAYVNPNTGINHADGSVQAKA